MKALRKLTDVTDPGVGQDQSRLPCFAGSTSSPSELRMDWIKTGFVVRSRDWRKNA